MERVRTSHVSIGNEIFSDGWLIKIFSYDFSLEMSRCGVAAPVTDSLFKTFLSLMCLESGHFYSSCSCNYTRETQQERRHHRSCLSVGVYSFVILLSPWYFPWPEPWCSMLYAPWRLSASCLRLQLGLRQWDTNSISETDFTPPRSFLLTNNWN